MRRGELVTILLVAALAISGCGGGNKRKKVRAGGGTASTATTAAPVSAPDGTFRAGLSGGKSGAPGAAATAVIMLKGKHGQACWKFTGLTGVAKPTVAYVWRGSATVRGAVLFPLSTSPRLKLTGCSPAPINDIVAIEHNPAGAYVTVSNKQYPLGAIRGQL